ncbi:MAG: hypothetical protein KJN98_07800, partial [Pontiella sp.]|nr:hypothetical protein [Pontiella sp.]
MHRTRLLPLLILLMVVHGSAPARADELKRYYEEQVELFKTAFQAPMPGSEIRLKLAGGQTRTGILMKLSADEISVMTDSGMVSYRRLAVHESVRARFFAEDFAHAMALDKIREFRQQQMQDTLREQLADTHDGGLVVVARADKSSDKSVDEEERESRSGTSFTITTATRTYTLIQNLKITVSNRTNHPDTYALEWYFYASPVGTGNLLVHDKGGRRVPVDSMKRVVETVASKSYVVE